jgi:DNA-binding beta-propeller fold protein YncE
LPGAIARTGDRAVVVAADVGKQATEGQPDSVHVLEWSQAPRRVGGADAFGHNHVIVGGAALTSDGKTFLVGDTNGFSGNLNAVAAVDLGKDGARPAGGVAVDDPEAIATSPFGRVAIVTSTFSDAIYVLDAHGQDGKWQLRGQVPYRGRNPQLPSDVATIDRGAARGNVYVSENVSVRRLAFKPDGSVEDLGSLQFGQDLRDISGAIGVTK